MHNKNKLQNNFRHVYNKFGLKIIYFTPIINTSKHYSNKFSP